MNADIDEPFCVPDNHDPAPVGIPSVGIERNRPNGAVGGKNTGMVPSGSTDADSESWE